MKEIAIKLGLAGIAALAPIHAVLISVGVLIFADLITGVLAARKRGEAITSAGFRRTIVKMCVFQLAVVTGFLLETHLLGGIIPVVNLVAGAIGMSEGFSLFENIAELYPELGLKKLLKRLGSDNDTPR